MIPCRALAASVALGTIMVSCRLLPLPLPGQYRCSRGAHVVVYHVSSVEDDLIEAFLATADEAWLEVLETTGLPLVIEPVVVVDQAGPTELRLTWSSYYVKFRTFLWPARR